MYTVGGLFAGVGGIELGFEQADKGGSFKVNWSNEFDANACKTYRLNFPKHNLIEADIWEILSNNFIHEGNQLADIDVLVGGFPCQAFSVAGYRKGFEDPRGNLFFAILEFIKRFQPKAILLENVKNLQGHDSGRTFARIYSELDSFGYSVIHKVLNTCEYTKIPHTRERIFIICFKDENEFNKGPIFEENKSSCSEAFLFPNEKKDVKSIKQMLSRSKVQDKYYYTKEKSYMYDKLEENMTSSDTVYQWRRKYVRENKNNLCPTLTANMGTGGHNVPLVIDSTGGIRKLTPKECFKFQGFDKIKLPSDMADTQLYKQAGNSVSVPLIKLLAEAIKVSLDKKYH